MTAPDGHRCRRLAIEASASGATFTTRRRIRPGGHVANVASRTASRSASDRARDLDQDRHHHRPASTTRRPHPAEKITSGDSDPAKLSRTTSTFDETIQAYATRSTVRRRARHPKPRRPTKLSTVDRCVSPTAVGNPLAVAAPSPQPTPGRSTGGGNPYQVEAKLGSTAPPSRHGGHLDPVAGRNTGRVGPWYPLEPMGILSTRGAG